jgi:hypothetical protein
MFALGGLYWDVSHGVVTAVEEAVFLGLDIALGDVDLWRGVAMGSEKRHLYLQ